MSRQRAGRACGQRELMALDDHVHAIRCDHDGLKMAEVMDGHLILRDKHHGETHVKVVALAELVEADEARENIGMTVRDGPKCDL